MIYLGGGNAKGYEEARLGVRCRPTMAPKLSIHPFYHFLPKDLDTRLFVGRYYLSKRMFTMIIVLSDAEAMCFLAACIVFCV